MESEISTINRKEVLKYLAYRGGFIPGDIDLLIDSSIQKVISISKPRYTYRKFNLIKDGDEIILENTDFSLPGNDIKELLRDSSSCILLATTLGIEIDRHIRAAGIRDLTESVVLDSCASSAVESVVNDINSRLEDEYREKNLFLTDRFSPGYGDMPVSAQRKICDILDVSKSVGINITGSGIMIPRKSVTAIIGISDRKQSRRFSGCENCSLFMNCQFRKNNETCRRSKQKG